MSKRTYYLRSRTAITTNDSNAESESSDDSFVVEDSSEATSGSHESHESVKSVTNATDATDATDTSESDNDEFVIGDVEATYETLLDGWNENLTKDEIKQYQPLIDRVKEKYIDFAKVLRANLLETEKESALEQLIVSKQMLEDLNISTDFFAIQNKLAKTIKLHESYTVEQLERYRTKEEELAKKIDQTELRFELLDLEIDLKPKIEIIKRFHHLEQLLPGEDEYAKHHEWINYARTLPWNTYTPLAVNEKSTVEEKQVFVKDILDRWDRKQGYVRTAKEEMVLNLVDQFSTSKTKGQTGLRPKILTLCGPPGVGKTLFMKSFAEILGMGIYWIDFSGATDPSIIRGHHFTYQGSTPGRIIKGAIELKSKTGIFVLEEIDKIVQSFGSENKVENALISLLDRTRSDWIDDYLEFPFDISNYMFVTTINDEKLLTAPLHNRLHIIHFPAYDNDQKLQIAKQFEIPHALNVRAIDTGSVVISDDIIKYIIHKVDKEPGVRNLKRAVESIIQRANFYLKLGGASGIKTQFHIDDFQVPFIIKEKHVDCFLAHMKPTDEAWRNLYN